MKSTGKDCNTITIIYDCEEKVKRLNSDFGPREEHNHPQYLGVPRTKSQYSFEETSKNESHSLTSSNESPGNVSKIGPFPADINMCTNELSTTPQTNRDLSRQFHNDEEHIGKKATSAQMCSRKMEIVNNAEPNYSTCKYLQKGNSLVKSIEEDYDRSCIYSLSQKDNLPTGNSSLQTGNPSLQIGNSSLQTSNLNLHPGKWNLQTGILSSIDDNSRLQAGNNWKLSGPCKHGLCSSKKPSSDDGLSCRICHSVTDLETLVSPCLCTGSMKYVHESCLLNWLKSCVKTKCELCLHEVPVKKLVKPLREWHFLDEKPVPIIWLVSFLILFTLNFLSVIKDASRGCTSTTCIVFYVLGCSGAILGVIFLWFWAKKSAVYFKKLLILNQVWSLDEKHCKTDKKKRTLDCNV